MACCQFLTLFWSRCYINTLQKKEHNNMFPLLRVLNVFSLSFLSSSFSLLSFRHGYMSDNTLTNGLPNIDSSDQLILLKLVQWIYNFRTHQSSVIKRNFMILLGWYIPSLPMLENSNFLSILDSTQRYPDTKHKIKCIFSDYCSSLSV